MKAIIALLLSATGAAAFSTGVKAATIGLGFANPLISGRPDEIFAPAATTAFPVKDAPLKRRLEQTDQYKLIKSGAECNSDDAWLGRFDKVKGCADKCAQTEGCRYFIYGIAGSQGDKTGSCYHEKTSDATCSEGWESDSYDFYESVAATAKELATAAERAECLAGSDGSCDKCCKGITGVCVTDRWDLDELTEEDDCVLVKGDSNTINAKGGDDAIVVEGDRNDIYGGDSDDAIIVKSGERNTLHGGRYYDGSFMFELMAAYKEPDGDDTLTVVKGNHNTLYGGFNNDKLTIESGSNNRLYGGAGNTLYRDDGTDTFYIEGVKTQESKTDGKGNKTKQGSTTLIVGLCVGAAVLVIVLAVVVRKLRGAAAEETSMPQIDTEAQVEA